MKTWLVLACSAAAVAAALVLLPPGWIGRAETALAPWRPWLGGARIAAIVAAWIWWDRLVAALPGLPEDAAAHLRKRRRFWTGALVAVELVVVRNVFGALWRLAA